MKTIRVRSIQGSLWRDLHKTQRCFDFVKENVYFAVASSGQWNIYAGVRDHVMPWQFPTGRVIQAPLGSSLG